LKLYEMNATFFVTGDNVELHPDIARRIVAEGHAIGNHSWNHPDLTTVTEAEIDYQLRSTNTKIQQVTGIKPTFARPPYGSTNETVRNVMAKNGPCARSSGLRTALIGRDVQRSTCSTS
jgi:peptidoglycan/xylan/chitin deacetylase (PgdA/CDA1 family)